MLGLWRLVAVDSPRTWRGGGVMDEQEALAALAEQMSELASVDQERAHVNHDAALVVEYWRTLRDGGLPEELADDLTRGWHEFVLGYHANRPDDEDDE